VTVALSLKVNDGLVLAADSASTLAAPGGVANIHNNANKITNLRKGAPIGTITWGMGSLGVASISTLLKDLRLRFTDPEDEWAIDPMNYAVADVAGHVREFLVAEFERAYPKKKPQGALGVVVAGYSPGHAMAEAYAVELKGGAADADPKLLQAEGACGVSIFGQPEAIHRLMWGFSTNLAKVLEDKLGVPAAQIPAATQTLRASLVAPLLHPAMPLQDAIDLAEFLVQVTIQFARFSPQAPTVGGPIEIAAISKHEGFKWVKRKHYYSQELNPREEFL
jgi:hypothetical protein